MQLGAPLQDPNNDPFELAVESLVSGHLQTLELLVQDHPSLITARSQRSHQATLLHYLGANGVENERQKSPKNAAEIADLLLRHGAHIDATANLYGGGATTLGLVATSTHPRCAGVQIPLMEKLIEYGANVEGNAQSGSLVNACLANGHPSAAEFLWTRGATLDIASAAGLGLLDLLNELLSSMEPKVVAGGDSLIQGFVWACAYGQTDTIERLLRHGVRIDVQDRHGQTGLHHAAIMANFDSTQLLLKHNHPLEVENIYGGTVLGQALWSAANLDADAEGTSKHRQVIELLLNAGAEVPKHYPAVSSSIEDLLERRRSKRSSAKA